jgi:glycerol kinase
MDYIVAIDQGTHASRAVVLDARGRVAARQLCAIDLVRPGPGRAEQDAQQIIASIEQALHGALQQLRTSQRDAIRCCGITTQRSTVLAWRHNGAVLSPALNWQDTRGANQLGPLRNRAGTIRTLSGLPLSAHYGATKLHWLHQLSGNDPDIRIGPLSSFLLQRLAQEPVFSADHSNAQRMQLFDIRALDWSTTLSRWFNVPVERLPACKPLRARHATLRALAVPVSAVAGDQNAAWFAGGAPDPATALVNLGSGAFVLATQAQHTDIPDLLTSIVDSDAEGCSYVSEGTVNGAANALRWLSRHYRISQPETRLGDWLKEVEHAPLFMNSVGGLGSPWWREDLPPAFSDASQEFSDAQRTVAVAESILFLVQQNLDRIGRRQTLRRLRVSGGLSRIAPLCQKLANLSQLPVERPEDSEASARGIAWLAAGRPQGWRTAGQTTLFRPLVDAPLRARYQRFNEKLDEFMHNDGHE